VGNGFGRAITM